HEQGVRVRRHVVAGGRPEQSDGSGHERKVVGDDVLAEQRLRHPAPRSSAVSITSSAASRAPCPMSIITLVPSLRIPAARSRSGSCGITRGFENPIPVYTAPCSRGGDSTASSS